MNQPKVSIIIPVHNAGHYLEKCLASLVDQTLEEIEIILVFDCPTDGSDKVAESFASQDSRIKLLYNEENLHTGLSRNKGMEVALGEYIGFHDHDDYCEPTMYEQLYKKALQNDFDVVRCNFNCVYTKTSLEVVEQYKYPEKIAANSFEKEYLYENVSNDNISCVIWNHIYKANFLKQHNIKFLDSRAICSEDSIFFLEVYDKVNRLGTISDYLYYHIFHSNNTGKIYNYRSIHNRISFFEEIYSFLQKNNISDEQSKLFLSKNIARSLYSGSRQALFSLPIKKVLAEIKDIKRSKLMIECIRYLYRKENRSILFSLKPTVIIFLFMMKGSAKRL